MRKLTFLIIVFSFLRVQSQEKEWLIASGGEHADTGNTLVVDETGNIYMAGSFQGEGSFGNQKLNSEGDTDIFLSKYSSSGDLLWVKQSGSNFVRQNSISEYPTKMILVDDGILMTGVFMGIGVFGDILLTSAGKEDMFIAKYDFDGNVLWAERAGGVSQDIAYDIAVDAESNLYVTGFFQKEASFGDIMKRSINQRDYFLAKYTSTGQPLWVVNSKSGFLGQGKAVSITQDGVVVGGDFYKELHLGDVQMEANGSSDGFIAKHSFDGEILWARSFGSDGLDQVNDIEVDSESIYIAGSFLSNGTDELWLSKGARDGFAAKLSINGDLLWNKVLGGSQNDEVQSIEISANGLLVAGKFSYDFETDEETYLSNGFTDSFISQLSEEGDIMNIHVIGGSGQDYPSDIYIHGQSIFLAGLFSNQLASNTVSVGASDAFLAKIPMNLESDLVTKVTYLVYPNPAQDEFWVESDELINKID